MTKLSSVLTYTDTRLKEDECVINSQRVNSMYSSIRWQEGWLNWAECAAKSVPFHILEKERDNIRSIFYASTDLYNLRAFKIIARNYKRIIVAIISERISIISPSGFNRERISRLSFVDSTFTGCRNLCWKKYRGATRSHRRAFLAPTTFCSCENRGGYLARYIYGTGLGLWSHLRYGMDVYSATDIDRGASNFGR